MTLVKKWLPAVLILAFLFWSSSTPELKISQDVSVDFPARKLVHFVVYGLLCASFYRATGSFVLSIGLSGLYGVFDEFHQVFTPLRNGKMSDIAIDIFGALVSALVIWKLYPVLPKKLKNWLKP
ncbi:MAG: VanZ family protein [candidate division WWE3 bacterium GW2011_GWB1_44_4]|uniref:VanZ-like domain-containing protein n=2 Tax=Katanobacteria TaxID=422282 RepID=A0A1F4V4S2_UNCKA|nr:MAG: VanZ family protein [candidate division WWE3 bacterium GW2011_GWB1_44_4]OGC52050.1 MAG: hypothetical protein A2709_02835 [candidate division WWE3 bacterium RIFCSPHIGHO2_01_FULL_43_9]